ncbi:MAG: hypothetical protein NTX61_13440 [Bacteroidetes bacterium]|nr:hypothetical protein [Bacteroidota bacterium]
MQKDGDLVLYNYDDRSIWASGTAGSGAVSCYMQGDGNLVLSDSVGNAIWETGTSGHTGATLVLQDDRNLVISYKKGKVLWDTKTNIYTIDQLNETNPILLLPLRIETRFANSGAELWVRIFPDEIAIHNHEHNLTGSEAEAGKYYWKTLWKNRTLTDYDVIKKKNWGQIVNHFGANRAKWIIQQTKPAKLIREDDFTKIKIENDLSPDSMILKIHAWSEAASCRVMPDFLKLQLYIGEKIVYEKQGNPIPDPLPMGPDPKAFSSLSNPDLDWTNTPIEWLENFNKAVELGMGFKVPLDKNTITDYIDTTGFSRLVVSGVRTDSFSRTDPSVLGATALNMLLENHLYGLKGLAILSQGTPTNNTEAGRSGLNEQKVFSEELYQQELQDPYSANSIDDRTDGHRLVDALSIDQDILRTIENACNTDALEAIAMNKALYPATLGFYLEHLLHPLFSDKDLKQLHDFVCSYVTGRGPLSAFRIGDQPYGILPSSDFKMWKWVPDKQFATLYQNLTLILKELDSEFETQSKKIATLSQQGKPHEILDEILGLYPNSEIFLQRVGYSEDFLRNYLGQLPGTAYRNPLIIDLLGKIRANINASSPLFPLMNILLLKINKTLNASPEGILQLSKIIFEQEITKLDGKHLVDLLPASDTGKLSLPEWMQSPMGKPSPNYIQWLRSEYIREGGIYKKYFYNMSGSGTGTDSTPPTTFEEEVNPPLLYLLLRHSLLLELFKSAFQWLKDNKLIPSDINLFSNGQPLNPNFIAGKEFFNFFNDDITPFDLLQINNYSILKNKISFLGSDETLAHYLLTPSTQPERIKELFANLQVLEDLTTARLERTFIEHLDCLTYRLDAWQTGLFYQKLETNRKAGSKGICLGAFGWLENVKAKLPQTYRNTADLPAELRPANGLPVIDATDIGGYIQAPSIGQAKTSALLRNGYLNYYDPLKTGLMAVNLTSERVRKALHLFEGVQKGQQIEVLLGYRFERSLHDYMLDQYIQNFRTAFPFNAKTIPNPDGSSGPENPENTNARNPSYRLTLLNGKAIVDTINAVGYPIDNLRIDDKDKIEKCVDDLFDCVDAMKDLLVAESVYQLTKGSMDRAGAILKSIGELKPPPVFEFMNTPRTAQHLLTNRACLLFDGTLHPWRIWQGIEMTPRAHMEPSLNKWIGEIIGQPDTIECFVAYTNTVDPLKSENHVVQIKDLGLQPLDLIYLIGKNLNSDDSELSQRIGYFYKRKYKVSDDIPLQIDYGRASSGKISFSELFPLLSRMKDLITNAKPLDAADFDLKSYTGKINPNNINLADLEQRKKQVVTPLKAALKILKQSGKNPEALRKALITCANLGIPNAFPVSVFGEEEKKTKVLKEQALSIYSTGLPLLNLIDTQPDPAKNSLGTNEKAKQLIEKLQLLFGRSFKVLPRFHFTSQNSDEEVDRAKTILTAYEKESDIFKFINAKSPTRSRESQLQQWLNGISHVRPRMENFEMVRTLFNAFQDDELDLHIFQLPYEDGDSWLGLEFPEMQMSRKAKVSMLVHYKNLSSASWKTDNFCGLLLDEWVEEIPGKEETTGITFQYDQPNSQPPQTLLLAISPEDGGKWSWNKLTDILNDTLNRAKKRGVDTTLIGKTDWASILPAVISEFSDTNANVSLFFRDHIKT